MTADKFAAAAIALLRSAVGWQSAIARHLDVDSRTVRRWLTDGQTPSWVEGKLAELIGARDISPWPRDEWLIGDAVTADGRRREYIAHLVPPRFVARIVECDDSGPCPREEPADILSGVVYVIDGDDFGEVYSAKWTGLTRFRSGRWSSFSKQRPTPSANRTGGTHHDRDGDPLARRSGVPPIAP
jgi:hypothetical protein